MSNKKYFVTGIDTDAGKSVICAILIQALKADYWKPVQAGSPTDSDFIKKMVSNDLKVHPEGIMLKYPMSPHASAAKEHRTISLKDINCPDTNNTLVIEGAGGIMVPINKKELVIDAAKQFDAEVILVSKNYLGSINHTLLSIEYLKAHGYHVAGIVFNGNPTPSTESYILEYSGLKCIARIPEISNLNPNSIQQLADEIKFDL